jgi:hypothetical protein
MTEKIQLILEEIKLKCKDLYSQLESERSKNLELENRSLKKVLHHEYQFSNIIHQTSINQ